MAQDKHNVHRDVNKNVGDVMEGGYDRQPAKGKRARNDAPEGDAISKPADAEAAAREQQKQQTPHEGTPDRIRPQTSGKPNDEENQGNVR